MNKISKYIVFFKLRYVLLLFIVQGSLYTSFAQEVPKKDVTAPETKKEKILEKKQSKKLYSFGQFAHESSLFVQQPTKWKGNDWLKLGLVVAATGAVMTLDKPMYNATQGNQRYFYSVPIVGGRVYGEWYSIGAVTGVFAAYGIMARDTAAKKISIELLQAGLYSMFATYALKIVIGRERPTITTDPQRYHPFTITNSNFNSFPSGHTTTAVALSTVMSRHANTTFLKIAAYAPAALTMFSRIYQNKHWFSDEIPGAAIGYFVGNWVVDMHEGKRHRINVVSVYPPTITYSLDREITKK